MAARMPKITFLNIGQAGPESFHYIFAGNLTSKDNEKFINSRT